jgi:hypothetical protein
MGMGIKGDLKTSKIEFATLIVNHASKNYKNTGFQPSLE